MGSDETHLSPRSAEVSRGNRPVTPATASRPRAPVLLWAFNRLIALSAYAGISFWGFQYAYFTIFSRFQRYDDEGTMMLRVWAFLKDPASYDILSGMYGPFYYLQKYAIYSLLGVPVSHDVTRLTTIATWLLIAALGAAFVHRMTRSIVFAALTQLQLLRHLSALSFEPGHPQEVSLVLIVGAVLLSSFVNEGRRGVLVLMGIGIATGALLLVKVNLGLYLLAPLALAVLLAMRSQPLTRVALFVAILVALLVPPAIMWGHLDEPWALNYDSLVTFTIASCLVVSLRDGKGGSLTWYHVAAIFVAAMLTMASICAVLVAWGSSLMAIADGVILRPLRLPGAFVTSSEMTWRVVAGGGISLLVALAYGFRQERLSHREAPVVALALGKLAYGCILLFTLYRSSWGLLRFPIALPFVWLVLVPPGGSAAFESRFPRLLLCFTAAFQALQAYPVYGSQARWAALLLVPAAVLCVSDALPPLVERVRLLKLAGRQLATPWDHTLAGLIVLCCIFTAYVYRTDVPALRATYEANTPLNLAGAQRIRLPSKFVQSLRLVVGNLNAYCDGFVGMPGFASLYFWTPYPPPGILNNAWMVNPDDQEQRIIMARMETYLRPCVLYNRRAARFWLHEGPVASKALLAEYIRTNYKRLLNIGEFVLLVKKNRKFPSRKRKRALQ